MINAAFRNFCHILILTVLAGEAAGCLLGGTLLMIAPDGRLMNMPVEIIHGAFADFMWPGMILCLLGIVNIATFVATLRRSLLYQLFSLLALGVLLGWFWIEIAILQQLHWLHLIWGGPVVAAFVAALLVYPWTQNALRKTLLACGITASVLYAAINIIIPPFWPAYQVSSQTVSELSAVGAPTRFVWNILCAPYTLLMIAFAFGMVLFARDSRPLKIAGILLLIYALLGVFWPFAAMHQRAVLASGGGTVTDRLHLALGALTETIYLMVLYFTARALGKAFRIYSLSSFVLLAVCGTLTFLAAPGVAANAPTPLIGVWERINIGVFLLWVIVLAAILISTNSTGVNTAESADN